MAITSGVPRLAESDTEHALVRAVRTGDDRAFEELFCRYRARISAYVGAFVGDHGRAEDITQEVFISALRRLRETATPIAFRAWIYEIARNACIDEFRRARRVAEVPLDPDPQDTGVELDLSSPDSSPDHAVEARQRLDDLRGAFRGLSETHHRILVLRELEGLSYEEIGRRLEMSRAMVESTLFRARRRLHEEYQELVSGRRCEQVRALLDYAQSHAFASLGIRDRRVIGRHLAHCQDCRRHAHASGLGDTALRAAA